MIRTNGGFDLRGEVYLNYGSGCPERPKRELAPKGEGGLRQEGGSDNRPKLRNIMLGYIFSKLCTPIH